MSPPSGNVHRGDAPGVIPRRGYSSRWCGHLPRPENSTAGPLDPAPALKDSNPSAEGPALGATNANGPAQPPMISCPSREPRSIPSTPHTRRIPQSHTERLRGPVSWRMLPNDVISAFCVLLAAASNSVFPFPVSPSGDNNQAGSAFICARKFRFPRALDDRSELLRPDFTPRFPPVNDIAATLTNRPKSTELPSERQIQ